MLWVLTFSHMSRGGEVSREQRLPRLVSGQERFCSAYADHHLVNSNIEPYWIMMGKVQAGNDTGERVKAAGVGRGEDISKKPNGGLAPLCVIPRKDAPSPAEASCCDPI